MPVDFKCEVKKKKHLDGAAAAAAAARPFQLICTEMCVALEYRSRLLRLV